MYDPTDGMRKEGTLAQFTSESDFQGPIPKIQFLTIADVFQGRRIRVPGKNMTPREHITPSKQLGLPLDVGVKKAKPEPPEPVAYQVPVAAPEALKAAEPTTGPGVYKSTPPPEQAPTARKRGRK